MFIYFRGRETQIVSGGGAEREGDTEPKAGSELSAQSPMRGLNSRGLRDHDLSRSRPLNRLSHPGATKGH